MKRNALLCLVVSIALSGCYREQRKFEAPPEGSKVLDTVRLTEQQPGERQPGADGKNAYEENAYAMAQGKKWFRWYNCNGCHAAGGGNMGPALMDAKWIYGSEPQQIFATIAQGRPNGMPSFRGHIPDDQIWQLVAYIRSMNGLVDSSAAPSRSDAMQAVPAENSRNPEKPVPSSVPPASTR